MSAMPRTKRTIRRPKGGDPLAAGVPPGSVLCMRCSWPFATENPRTNRICPWCTANPPSLSRRELCEARGGHHTAQPE